jgi:CRP-like cAMP-binding protein
MVAVTGATSEGNEGPVRDAGDAKLFAACPAAERDIIRTLAVPLRVSAGEDIVGQGDFGASIGVVLEGEASVWLNDEHVADLAAGDCFGELAVLATPGSAGQRAARVRADTEVRVDTVARRELVENLSDIPSIAEKLREQAASY